MTFSEFFFSALNAMLLVLIPLIGTYLTKLIREHAVIAKNEVVQGYLDIATDAVIRAMDRTSQVFVDALKSDGKFTREEWSTAMALTVEGAKEIMGEAALAVVERMTGDAGKWIEITAEAMLKQSKAPRVQ